MRRRTFAPMLAALACAACSLDWTIRADDAGPERAGDAATGADAARGADAGGGARDAAGGGGADALVAPDAGTCASNADCAGGAYCHFPDHQCGSGAPGVCRAEPAGQSCPIAPPWACTCDGTVDTSGECGAASKGNDTSLRGCSSPPPGTVCGYLYCANACATHVAPGETTYSCQ